jgi:hypothetical protein
MNKLFKLGILLLGLFFYQGDCDDGGGAGTQKRDVYLAPDSRISECSYRFINLTKVVRYNVTVYVEDPNTGQFVSFSTKFFEKGNDWKEQDGNDRVLNDIVVPNDQRGYQISIYGEIECSKCAKCLPPAYDGQGFPRMQAISDYSSNPQVYLDLKKLLSRCSQTGGQILDCN